MSNVFPEAVNLFGWRRKLDGEGSMSWSSRVGTAIALLNSATVDGGVRTKSDEVSHRLQSVKWIL